MASGHGGGGMRSRKYHSGWPLIVALALGATPLAAAAESAADRQQIYDNFRAAYAAQDWETARTWARRLIAAKEADAGPDSPELIVSLINSAAVDLELVDWQSALAQTERGLTILDRQPQDHIAQRLALLMTKARALLGLRDAGEAHDVLQEALRVNRSSQPADQWTEAEIQSLLVEVAKQEGDRNRGNVAVRRSLKAREAHFTDQPVGMAAYYLDASRWYRYSTQFGEERKLHEKAIDVLEDAYGENDARLATPLMGVAATYMMPHKSPKKARAALERALGLNYPDEPEAALLKARVMASYGDHHIVYGDSAQGMDLYRDAWREISDGAGLGAGVANDYFAEPVRLYFNPPDRPANTGKGADFFREGFVELEFTIGPDGRLGDIVVARARPLEMREELFIKAAEKARYRPRVIDGEPVATPGAGFRQTYEYE